jgi:DNA polymerase delta subunit 1
VVVKTASFRPYFYARIPNGDGEAGALRERLEAYLRSRNAFRNRAPRYVLRLERVQKRSLCGWHRHRPLETMYRFTMALPAHVKQARDSLEARNPAVTHQAVATFEANLPFELRYMVDAKLRGCQWFRVRGGCFQQDGDGGASSRAQYDLTIVAGAGGGIDPVDIKDKSDIAPMRYLSFDLEAKRKRPGFVKADEDPVVLICAVLWVVGTGIAHTAVFAFVDNPDHSLPPVGDGEATVYLFRDERELLLAFAQYVRECDPDAFTGWNIANFDWPYLCGRAKALGIFDAFMDITRMPGERAYVRTQTFQSKAFGTRTVNDLVCEGRFDFDALTFMLRGVMKKYRSYKLNSIAKEELNDTKVDIHHTQIPVLHESPRDADRGRLAFYCLKDALLPLRILDKLMAVVNGIEQSRVTGVSIKWLLSRGQGVKVISCIHRAKADCEVIPTRTGRGHTDYTKGGLVRDPMTGFRDWPVATLDFSSLYPSIMQAYNICYSTVEYLDWARANLQPGDYDVPPGETEFCFVRAHVRQGVLPDLLTGLLAQRAYVKKLLETATDKALREVLDGRQLAIKVVANSVYGFLKGYSLVDPRLMRAVTQWGQEMILKSGDIVMLHFHPDNGHFIVDRKACERLGLDYERPPPDAPRMAYPARIVYGDTDSIMIDYGDIGIQDVARYTAEAARLCTAAMRPPNKLAFESIKIKSLLLKKKRYGSLEILTDKLSPDDTIATASAKAKLSFKGLESKRRDNAPIGSETQAHVLKLILKEGDVEAAVKYVQGRIADILLDRVDMSKFVISKGLSKTDAQYKAGGMKQQHTELKKRIAARARYTGEVVPETGDRVPFVMLAGAEGAKSCELSEDPRHALLMGLPIDTRYYIKKQVMAATLRVFTGVWEPQRLELLSGKTWTKARIGDLLAYQRLFRADLPHMLHRVERHVRRPKGKVAGGDVSIVAHTVTLPQCAQPGCSVRIAAHMRSHVVCDEHVRAIAQGELERELERRTECNQKAWATCIACVGAGDVGGVDAEGCANMDCPNYFYRRRALMDVEDLAAVLDRFQLPDKTAAERAESRALRRTGLLVDKPREPPAKAKRATVRRPPKFVTKRDIDDVATPCERCKCVRCVCVAMAATTVATAAAAPPTVKKQRQREPVPLLRGQQLLKF